MKKVKIMLLSAAVLAVVGGALAFKAKSYSPRMLCGFTTSSCPTIWTTSDLTTINVDEPIVGLYCTTPEGNIENCTTVEKE